VRAGRRPRRGGGGKITELRALARRDAGLASACLLAALGTQPESDNETARAYVGALIMVEAADDLRVIRKLLTPKE
jgi:hypothetical protein